MNKILLHCLAMLIAVGGTAAQTAADDARDSAVRPTKVIRLFDGRSLDGFYTWMKDTQREDPRKVFRVTDGMLHVTGDGLGGLLTNKEYRDYHCILEIKWGPRTWGGRTERTKDSGLLIHSVGADGGYNGTWMPSIEAQIIEGGFGDFILVSGKYKDGKPVPLAVTSETARDRDGEVIWKEGGQRETFNLQNSKRINWYGRDPDWKDVLGFRGKHDDGGHIQIFVNGVKVNEAFDSFPTHGRLQLQTELAECFVRRWEKDPSPRRPRMNRATLIAKSGSHSQSGT